MLDELKLVKDITSQEILSSLLDGTENLDLKTRIHKPKQLAGFETFGKFLGDLKHPKSSKRIEGFIQIYLRYMVSFKGFGRINVLKAISHTMEDEERKTITSDLG